MRRLWPILLGIFGVAVACINDRDTLAFEARNIDALNRIEKETDEKKRTAAIQELALRAIGGRFERFPDRYYQMRIERLKAKDAISAKEWDDLSVAYDRLGKVDEAIRTIIASKPHRRSKDDNYRFHANYGTFLVHRWFVNGHRREDLKTLDESIAEIQEALRINPNAHFGRERVQLALEQSWRQGKRKGDDPFPVGKIDEDDLVVGLSGIAMMGLGYELPDVYELIGDTWLMGGAEETILPSLAQVRAQELTKAGKPGLLGLADGKPPVGETRRAYLKLKANGEAVYQSRLKYMNARFSRGEHPDTHPAFWKEWKEPPYPVPRIVGSRSAFVTMANGPVLLVAVAGGALGLAVILILIRSPRRGKAAI